MQEEIFALIDQRLRNRDRESLADFVQRTRPHRSSLMAQAAWVYANRAAVVEYLSDETHLQEAVRFSLQGVKQFVYSRNQFLDLDGEARAYLRGEYTWFYRAISAELARAARPVEFEANLERLTLTHLARISGGLEAAARLTAGDRSAEAAFLSTLVCAEYSPQAQLAALHLDLPLAEPVLDLGCGSQASLSRYLAAQGVDVLGLDRSAPPEAFCRRISWDEFDYGRAQWGTILSHQAFSTHFTFNHRHSQARATGMARVLMGALAGLRPVGIFAYTPGLPFIEPFLAEKEGFTLARYPIPGAPEWLAGLAYACHVRRER